MKKFKLETIGWDVDYIDDETIIVCGEKVVYSIDELNILGAKIKDEGSADGALKLHYLKKIFNGKIIKGVYNVIGGQVIHKSQNQKSEYSGVQQGLFT